MGALLGWEDMSLQQLTGGKGERLRAAVEAYVLHSLVWVNSFLMQGEMFSHYSLVGTA